MNLSSKQTIEIFLAEGNPTGIRILEVFNWNGKGIIIPRDRVEVALKREDLQTQGLYFLLGENRDGDQMLYIGETENLCDRLKSHHKTRDFWEVAICFYSKDNNLNKAHVKFLEELLIRETNEAKRVTLENGNQPVRTKLSESDVAKVTTFAEYIKIILSAVGFTFLKKPTDYEKSANEIYICTGPAANAQGIYTSEGFVVLKGSLVRKEIAPSAKGRYLKRRIEFLTEKLLSDYNEESYIFTEDVVFTSPSNAAQNILARNANGWTEWKRKNDGKSLDEVLRQ